MYQLCPLLVLLVLLVGSHAQNYGNNYLEANDTQIDLRSIFSNRPLRRTRNDVIYYQQRQEAREGDAMRNETFNTPPFQSPTTTDQTQQPRNNENDLNSIIRYLQQRATNATSTPSVPIVADAALNEIIKILQQRVNRSAATPAPVPTASVVTNLPRRYTYSTVSPFAVPDADNGVETCTLQSGEPGECTHYYLCHPNSTANTDGTTVIDIRSGFTSCSSYLDVCCRPPDHAVPDPPAKPREGCGWRNKEGQGFRVTGAAGGEANFGEFPWMVAILKHSDDFDHLYAGGGSLIHRSIVLTAAHILVNATTLSVRAGEWDTQTADEQYPHQDRDVAEVVVHKDYNKRNLFFDIALLFLASPVDPAPHIGVACLPRADAVPADGTSCFASGWGKDKFGKEGQYQAILKRVEVPVVSRAHCAAALRRTRLGLRFRLHGSFLCAGARGQDTCTGDGGSPLVCPTELADRYAQYGIVSWGIGCGGDAPGVYVAVAALRGWLDGEVTRRGHDPSVYSLD